MLLDTRGPPPGGESSLPTNGAAPRHGGLGCTGFLALDRLPKCPDLPRQQNKVCNGIHMHPSTSGAGEGGLFSLSEKLPSLEMANSISVVDLKSTHTPGSNLGLEEKKPETPSPSISREGLKFPSNGSIRPTSRSHHLSVKKARFRVCELRTERLKTSNQTSKNTH